MLLSLGLLYEKLSVRYPEMEVRERIGKRYQGILIWDKNRKEIDPDYLYVDLENGGYHGDIRKEEGWIVRGKDCPKEARQILMLPEDCQLPEVFNQVLLIWQKFQKWERKVSRAVAANRPLEEILNLTSLVTPDPVYLADASLKLIEYSKPTLMPDISAIWRYQMEYGYVPMNVVKKLIETGELHRLNTKRSAFDTPTESFNIPYTCQNLFIGGVLRAHLFLINVYSQPSRSKLEIVRRLGEMLRVYLENHPQIGSSLGSFQEDYFRDIIDRKLTNTALIRSQLSYFGWKINDTFQLLLVDTEGRKESGKQFLLARLSHQPENGCQAIEKDSCLLILYHQLDKKRVEKNLIEDLEYFGIRGALSAPFQNLAELPEVYEQARMTLEIGKNLSQEKHLYVTENYGIYRITNQILKYHSITEVCHPDVLRLYVADCRNKTEYIETLYQYLSNDRNVLKTSQALFVHRNTLSYRLKKIEAYLDVEQGPPETLHFILFSIYLLRTALDTSR